MSAVTFTYEADSLGYMIYCNGKPLGGARSAGTRTHTSWGSRRSWQAVRADSKMHAETARRECDELTQGRGQARFIAAMMEGQP